MNIVVLSKFIEAAVRLSGSMYHAPSHGNGFIEDPLQHVRAARIFNGIDTALRKCQVYRFGEVQQGRGGIPEILEEMLESGKPLQQKTFENIQNLEEGRILRDIYRPV